MVIFFYQTSKAKHCSTVFNVEVAQVPKHLLTSVVQKAEQLMKIYLMMLSMGYKIVSSEKNRIFSILLEIHFTVCIFILIPPANLREIIKKRK